MTLFRPRLWHFVIVAWNSRPKKRIFFCCTPNRRPIQTQLMGQSSNQLAPEPARPHTRNVYTRGRRNIILQPGQSSRQHDDSDSDWPVYTFFIFALFVLCLTLVMNWFSILRISCKNNTWIFLGAHWGQCVSKVWSCCFYWAKFLNHHFCSLKLP